MTIKLPEPCHMAISYDGKTPYSIPFEQDCELLDLEVKRLGGTACKLKLYTEAQLNQAIRDALEEAAKIANRVGDGSAALENMSVQELTALEIRKLKEQLK